MACVFALRLQRYHQQRPVDMEELRRVQAVVETVVEESAQVVLGE